MTSLEEEEGGLPWIRVLPFVAIGGPGERNTGRGFDKGELKAMNHLYQSREFQLTNVAHRILIGVSLDMIPISEASQLVQFNLVQFNLPCLSFPPVDYVLLKQIE